MAKTAAKKPPADDVEFFDVEQRGDEWFQLRLGLPTASKAALILASGKDGGESVGRERYMKRLACELITGQAAESFRSEAMERGVRMEPEARAWYERTRFVELKQIGFAKRTVRLQFPFEGSFAIGCSPDSQVAGKRKGVEIKTMAPDLLGDVQDRGAGGFPAEHRAQLQWTMWCCDWNEMDLLLYYTGWPNPPIFTMMRDEPYIAKLKTAAEKFAYELQQLTARWRGKR